MQGHTPYGWYCTLINNWNPKCFLFVHLFVEFNRSIRNGRDWSCYRHLPGSHGSWGTFIITASRAWTPRQLGVLPAWHSHNWGWRSNPNADPTRHNTLCCRLHRKRCCGLSSITLGHKKCNHDSNQDQNPDPTKYSGTSCGRRICSYLFLISVTGFVPDSLLIVHAFLATSVDLASWNISCGLVWYLCNGAWGVLNLTLELIT